MKDDITSQEDFSMKRHLTRAIARLCTLACPASAPVIPSLLVWADMSDRFADKTSS